MPNKPSWTMLKTQLQDLWQKAALRQYASVLADYVRSSWRPLLFLLPLTVVAYYVLGSWATHKIDKQTDFEALKPAEGLATVETTAFLVNREIKDHLWTPSLPWIFPASILDNMPAFQLGLVESLQSGMKAVSTAYDSPDLKEAAHLLTYPGDVWILSKVDNLSLAPSSTAQYRKAVKALRRSNKLPLKPQKSADKIALKTIKELREQLVHSLLEIEEQVHQHSTDWWDNEADSVFYRTQGRLYGTYVIIKALMSDYPMLEISPTLLQTLEEGLALEPFVVRNGMPNSLTAPNHLLNLGYYVGKAMAQMTNVVNHLQITKAGQ